MTYQLIPWNSGQVDGQLFTDLAIARSEALTLARETHSNVTVAQLRSGPHPDRAVVYCTPEGRVYPS